MVEYRWSAKGIVSTFLKKPSRSEAELIGEEARAYLAALKARGVASSDEIKASLGSLSQHYPMQNRTPEQWALYFEDFMEDLANCPSGDVAEACAEWRRTDARWFPTPGQLLKVIERVGGKRAHILRALEGIPHAVDLILSDTAG